MLERTVEACVVWCSKARRIVYHPAACSGHCEHYLKRELRVVRVGSGYHQQLTLPAPAASNPFCGFDASQERVAAVALFILINRTSAMPSSENRDLPELHVYKMLERLGIELGAGVIPRYGLMDISANRNCGSRGAASASTERLGAASSPAVAPEFCPNHDIPRGAQRRSTAKH